MIPLIFGVDDAVFWTGVVLVGIVVVVGTTVYRRYARAANPAAKDKK